MDDLQLIISNIEYRVRDIVAERKQLKEELEKSKAVIEELENQIETLNKQLRQHEENTGSDALAAALLSHHDRKDLKQQIDGMVNEIERCISLLKQ